MNRVESAVVGFFHAINRLMTQFAKLLGVWIADGVVAYQTAANLRADLHWSLPGAILAGLALECVGILVADTALALRRFNQGAKYRRAVGVELLAWSMVILQFAASVILMVFNTITGLTIYGLLVLAVLSGIGTLSHMLDQDREHREVEERDAIAEVAHQAQLAERRAERKAQRDITVAQQVAKVDNRTAILEALRVNAHATQREIAQQVGISPQAVSKRLRALSKAGVIMDNNGDGWEVLA